MMVYFINTAKAHNMNITLDSRGFYNRQELADKLSAIILNGETNDIQKSECK